MSIWFNHKYYVICINFYLSNLCWSISAELVGQFGLDMVSQFDPNFLGQIELNLVGQVTLDYTEREKQLKSYQGRLFAREKIKELYS